MEALIAFFRNLSSEQVTNIISNAVLLITLLITLISLRQTNRQLKASNYLLINQHHREIWMNSIDPKDFARVFQWDADPNNITDSEALIVNLILLHMSGTYKLVKKNACFKIDGMDVDLIDILSYPIPQAVWVKVRDFHDKDFARYVSKTLNKRRKQKH